MVLQIYEEIRTTLEANSVYSGFLPQHRSHAAFPWPFIRTDSRDCSGKRIAVFFRMLGK